LKAISEKIDFLGVNYYEQHVTLAIAGDNRRDAAFTYPGERRTAAGVGIKPTPHCDKSEFENGIFDIECTPRPKSRAVSGSPLST
jgi:beta-glucosidase/6-phospho-beta-glucosidase/beta-galactosidase